MPLLVGKRYESTLDGGRSWALYRKTLGDTYLTYALKVV